MRHYNSFISIRDQYNDFVQGRVNQMVEQCQKSNRANDPTNSVKANKAKADIIQTLKVTLEAQQQMLSEEIINQKAATERVS